VAPPVRARWRGGLVASLRKLAGLENWPVPDVSTLCRRQKTVAIQIPFWRSGAPLNLLVDSTGVKVRGEGEWQVRKHGASRHRQWRKVQLGMDTATGDIRAVEVTPSREGDSPVLPDLLDRIPRGEQIGPVTADGALDPRRCPKAVPDRGATAILPIRKNGRRRTRGRSRRPGQERDPSRLTALRPGSRETADRLSRPQPRRGPDAAA
jgi:hypothetical protein